jgi:hypothetical protein
LLIIFTEWFVTCFVIGFRLDRTPIATKHQGEVLGNIIFNYAFVTMVPSWLNEKVKNGSGFSLKIISGLA